MEANNTSAKVIADSISHQGKRITTFELVYPRFIHAELMTHRMLSKNAASSRAMPVSEVNKMVLKNPAMPVRFGANQSGMQDTGERHVKGVKTFSFYYPDRFKHEPPEVAWENAAFLAVDASQGFLDAGYHKQVCNRLTEPFQWIKVVLTGTAFVNFFWLRDHDAADPTFRDLAVKMKRAMSESECVTLHPGQWHMPYYKKGFWTKNDSDSLDSALAISISCCAQVSYRKLDDSIEKAMSVIKKLNLDGDDNSPAHASPAEHQATPMVDYFNSEFDEPGVTSIHKHYGKMSGNLAGWIQKRQLLSNHTDFSNPAY